MGSAVIFAGTAVKALKPALNLNGVAVITSSSTINPAVTAQSGQIGSLWIYTGDGAHALFIKTDNGSSTNWNYVIDGYSVQTLNNKSYSSPILTGGTQGSALFIGPGGTITQDNSQFFWDDTNHRLGIQTATPTSPLDVRVANAVPGIHAAAQPAGVKMVGTGPNGRFMVIDSGGDAEHLIYMSVSSTASPAYAEVSTYDYLAAAPYNLLLNSNGGNVGVSGALNPASTLSINGNASIGTAYATIAAPSNGLIVQGNVGIGTGATTPAKQLHVLSSANADMGIQIENTNVSDGGAVLAQFVTTGKTYQLAVGGPGRVDAFQNAFYMFDSSAGQSRLLISSAGLVGIGTTTPTTPLTVASTAGVNTFGDNQGQLSVFGPNTTFFSTTANLTVETTDAFGTDIGGTIGLGGRYHGAGDGAIFAMIRGLKENATSGDTSGYISFGTRPNGPITEKMRITSTGLVGIGTTSPQAPLQIQGSAAASPNAVFITTNSFTYASAGSLLRFGHGATSGNTYAEIDNLTTGGLGSGNLALQVSGGNTSIGSTTFTNLFNVGSNAQFQVTSTGQSLATSAIVGQQTIYVGSENGVEVSTNNGTSWTTYTTANGLASNFILHLYAIGNTIYAAMLNAGLAVSTNGGTSWTNYTTTQGLPSNSVTDVFAINSLIFAATGAGLAVSPNNGSTWTTFTTAQGLASNNLNRIYVDQTTGKWYVATSANGLSVSSNFGATWTNYTTAQGLPSNVIFAVKAVGNNIYVGTNSGFSVSTNSGSTWTNFSTSGIGVGTNVNDIFVLGNNVYLACNSGVAFSSNNGTSFSNVTNNITATSTQSIWATSIAGVTTVYVATYNGTGYAYSTNNGGTWTNVSGTGTTTRSTVVAATQLNVSSSGNLTQINDVVYNWPTLSGAPSTILKTDVAGNLSWAPSAWTTTVKTSAYTAVSGDEIFANTTGGAFTITLPFVATQGQRVRIIDYAGTWGANNVTVSGNGSSINGSGANFTLNVNNAWTEFVYVDSTQGWRVIS